MQKKDKKTFKLPKNFLKNAENQKIYYKVVVLHIKIFNENRSKRQKRKCDDEKKK